MNLGILVLIGLPGSGKTTFAKTLKNISHYQDVSYDFIHVCYDDLITFSMIDGEVKWKTARHSVLIKIKDLLTSIIDKDIEKCPLEFQGQVEEIKSDNIVIVIDDNMYYRSMRYSCYQVAKDYGIGFCQICFLCPLEQCLLINSKRYLKNMVPPYVIEEMHKKIELPNTDEKWEQFSLIVNSFSEQNEVHTRIFRLLKECLSHPEKSELPFDKQTMTQCMSIVHQADLALRQVISAQIKTFVGKPVDGIHLNNYSTLLSSIKKKFLNDLKSGTVTLPKNILEETENSEITEKVLLKSYLENLIPLPET